MPQLTSKFALRFSYLFAAFVVIFLSAMAPVRADQLARVENTLLIEQIADSYLTWRVLRVGGIETDPLARPFVGSRIHQTPIRSLITATSINGLIRLFDQHENTRRRPLVINIITILYVGVLVSNVTVLTHQQAMYVTAQKRF